MKNSILISEERDKYSLERQEVKILSQNLEMADQNALLNYDSSLLTAVKT